MKKQVDSNTLSPQQIKQLGRQSRKKIFDGSKSFSLASLLLSPSHRQAIHLLYRWCRFCDDEIDGVSNQDSQKTREKLLWLKKETRKAVEGEPTAHDVFSGLSFVIKTYAIPSQYIYELLEGMEMDVEKKEYVTFDDLTSYCYRVAGVVGLMICYIVGVSDVKALRHACDLGMAMQLSNIARDVNEDFLMGRVYLPSNWLEKEGLNKNNFLNTENLSSAFSVVAKLLTYADRWYSSGFAGLCYLSGRSRISFCAAALIYQEIGKKVLKQESFKDRVWVSLPKKIILIVKAFAIILAAPLTYVKVREK